MERLRLLTIPGYTGSGPQHWQSVWERADRSFTRVQQEDRDHPDPETWSARIDAAVRAAGRPVLLIAHTCGVTAVAHWTSRFNTRIAGAFLVSAGNAGHTNTASGHGPWPEGRRLLEDLCAALGQNR